MFNLKPLPFVPGNDEVEEIGVGHVEGNRIPLVVKKPYQEFLPRIDFPTVEVFYESYNQEDDRPYKKGFPYFLKELHYSFPQLRSKDCCAYSAPPLG